MKQQPTVLDIMRVTPSRYSFRLLRSDEPFIGATVQVWEVEVARDAILAMCNMVAQAVTAANCPTGKGDMALTPFEDAGKGLYNTLFPRFSYRVDELRSALRTLETPLLISTNDPEVLWELLHDGDPDGFFGLKYDLGRNLIT